MPKFFDDLRDKAQSAISATPLAQYVPGREQQQGASQPPPSQGGRSHALDALQHQFRTLQVQYGSGGSKDLRQMQLIITGQKGVVLDLEKEAQDSKGVSKDFYMWGQAENSDVKDVTDRLAYLTYVQGSLAAALASSLDASRAPLKALRDAEAHMQPKRNVRLNYELQITRLKNEGKPGTEQKLRELETLLKKAEHEDEPQEKEIELLKRKAIVDSETQKWQAIREYGEKLVLLSQACPPLLEALPSIPPTTTNPYNGAASTAATRATLQKALDNYKPGSFTLPTPSGADSETRSFGETHASELSRINSVASQHHDPRPGQSPSPPLSPPGHGLPPQPTAHLPEPIHTHPIGASPSSASSTSGSTPVNPHSLNNAPAPIPVGSPEPIPETAATEPESSVSPGSIPTSAPTVAETGMPVAAGDKGPGPASGSLAGGRKGSHGSSTTGNHPPGPGYGEAAPSYGSAEAVKYGLNDAGEPARHESAEDEKKRLEREDRERLLRNEPSRTASTSRHESAEDEKKRLEREERERVLRAGAGGPGPNVPDPDVDDGDGSTPPPYVEPR